MIIREITLICYGLACYLYLGYCFASIMRQLNLMRKDTPRITFIILMLFWPAGLIIVEDWLTANEGGDND
ncbi:hypothetical protein [Yersinia hibernica]|uniref:Uncharacterized protein n=1 Tax=Yersinia enterocolitica LC20 TaxID=1443113 RepID=A0A7U4GG85_YEREN|nr:hypothetical protein [Yersinia hibernica]AHM74534.1 hypothetical protein LC20_03281 [Yersinia hibernica]